MSENSSSNFHEKMPVRLAPLPLWKWVFTTLVLLSVPMAVLIQQTLDTFKASATIARKERSVEVEKLAGRLLVEMKTTMQLREVVKEFYYRTRGHEALVDLIGTFRHLNKVPLFYEAAAALYLAENSFARQIRLLEKRLRQLVPGIKLLRWGADQKISADSDAVAPKWAYQKLHESILESIKPENSSSGSRSYLNNVVVMQRYFGEDAPLAQFLKFAGEQMVFDDPLSRRLCIYWDTYKNRDFFSEKKHVGGFISIVDLANLPESYGLEMLLKRKSHEWSESGVVVGWINENSTERFSLPYPFPVFAAKDWVEWLKKRPDGHFERNGISVAKRRAEGGIILVAAKSIADIENHYHRNVFWLLLFIMICLSMPLFLVAFFRRNDGMAMSIRWQIFALFLLSLGLPGAAIVLLGSELLSDRQKSYETEAYQTLEKIKGDIEKNTSYAFRHLEQISETISRKLMTMGFDEKGKFVNQEAARFLVKSYGDQVNFSHFYLFNSAGESVMMESTGDETREGTGLLPLVQSLAKIKLRFSGNLRSSGKMGEVSMMDLLIEATGGISQEDVRNVLNNRSNRAFELTLSGRRSCFFVGEYFPKNRPEEAYIIVFLIKDTDFEKMFVRLMIGKIPEDDKLAGQVQLFFGLNDFSRNLYFYPAPLPNPWFNYTIIDADSLLVGRLSEPTRFDGIPVKEMITLKSGDRKCLLYSFRPSCLGRISLVALYDYEVIADKLLHLRLFILIIFLVSIIVGYVLARIMARSLIEPVSLLKQGVKQIEAGNYRTHLILPGQDELVELADAFNTMSNGLDQRERMTRYLSRSTVNAVVSGEDGTMGGKRVPATILFSDIRSFTTISESNDPETVVGLLNEYFAVMNRVVEEHGGDIDKFIGDAIMAQFIATGSNDETPAAMALAAIKCALQMMQALAAFNEQRAAAGLFPVKIGVGINSGEVIAGNIGSPGRMDRTVIGDTVNVASRLEGMSKLGRYTCIIISRPTLELVKDLVIVEQLSETAVKGKLSAVEMFEVKALA